MRGVHVNIADVQAHVHVMWMQFACECAVWVSVCVHVRVSMFGTKKCDLLQSPYIHVYICVCTYIYTYVIYIYIYIDMYMYTYTHIVIYIFMYICICTCMCTYTYVYIYIYKHICHLLQSLAGPDICIHMYIYTYKCDLL